MFKKIFSKKTLQPCLFADAISTDQRLAFVMSPRLGDSLLSMVIVNNLQRHHYSITVFSDYLYPMRQWFPYATIYPRPSVESSREVLSTYDILFHAYQTDIIGDSASWHSHCVVFDHSPFYRLRIPMPDIQVSICYEELRLDNLVRVNGICPPAALTHRRHKQRVIIHPTSSQSFRNWTAQKYLTLGHLLRQHHYDPHFIVAPFEQNEWLWIKKEGFELQSFANLSDAAVWIYESGWFIGNDSGIGHLASNLGIPTTSLIIRPSLARRWRPSWAPGTYVLPPKWLITRPLKERYWKHFISVNKAWSAFTNLVAQLNNAEC